MSTRIKRLSIIDQTLCRHYVRVSLLFPFSSLHDAAAAVVQIKSGLIATLQQLPYLAGNICLDRGAFDGSVILTYPDRIYDVQEPVFVVKERLGRDDPEYDALVGSGAPPRDLPGSKFGPLPDSPDLNCPSPVLGVCVAFIRGGLVLTIYSQHSVIDGRGLGYFIEDFAANVRAAGSQQERLLPGIWSTAKYLGTRRLSFPRPACLGQRWPCGNESARERINKHATALCPARIDPICPEFTPPGSEESLLPSPRPSTKGYIFVFEAAKLRALRDEIATFWRRHDEPRRLAVKDELPSFPRIIISTWDAIATLIWVFVTKARFHTGIDSGGMTRFGFTIDCRKRLPFQLPDRFLGNAALYTYADFLIPEFTAPGDVKFDLLAKVALHIRLSNMHFNQSAVKDRLAYFAQLPCMAPPGNAVNSTFGPDVFMTSWQEMGSRANFGIQGTMKYPVHGLRSYKPGMPTHVRKPGCVPTDGGVILLPRRKLVDQPDDAPFEVMIQLRDEDMERLLQQDEFIAYVKRIIK